MVILIVERVSQKGDANSARIHDTSKKREKIEFTRSTGQVRAQVKFESRVKFESGSIFLFFDFFLLFISSGCYFCLYNDVLVATVWFAIFFVIDRLSHYRYDSLSLCKAIPHPSVYMNFLRRLRPVFVYT